MNIFYRILRKVGFNKKSNTAAKLENVIIGENSEVFGNISKIRFPNSKLIIGSGCLIHCSISLETDNAIVEIGDNVFIGPETSIVCTNNIKIDSDILISSGCLIQDSDNHSHDFEIRRKDTADWKRGYHDWSKHPSLPIKISHGAWLGARVIVLKGVTIGEKAIVGAGSVVTKSVTAYTIVAGNPARFIRSLKVRE